jgi:hypothetical protein
MRRLQGIADDGRHIGREMVEVNFVSELGGEVGQGLHRVVLAAIERRSMWAWM